MSSSPQPGAQNSVAVYVSALTASHWKTRWQAAQALGELENPRAVEPLILALDDDNQWVRIVAAEALGQIGDKKAAEHLISSLDDNSVWVRRASVVALGDVGDSGAVPALMERLLRAPDSQWPEELHDVIAKALGAIGEPAIQVLIGALDDSDVWVSSAAAKALGQIGDPQAITPLAGMVKQENKWVRSAAIQALAQISDARAVRAALTTDEAPRAFWKLMALKEIGESTIYQLTALLDDHDEHIRARAAEVLGQLGDKRGDAESLVATFRDELAPSHLQSWEEAQEDDELDDAELQRVLDAALQQLQDVALEQVQDTALEQVQDAAQSQTTPQDKLVSEVPDSAKPLIAALQDPVAEVRLAAAEALGKIGNASTISILNQALNDDDSRVRATAARSLGEIGLRLAR